MTSLVSTTRASSLVTGATFALLLAASVAAQSPAKPATAPAPGVVVPKQTIPLAGKPKDFHVPPRRTFSLSNGMSVTLVPYGLVPKAVVQLVVRTGIIDESAEETSISSVTTDMLLEGTITKSPQDVARAAAAMGGSISAGAGYETAQIGGEILGEFTPQFVALLADVTRHPRFADADFKRIIDKQARDNAMSLAQPGVVAQVAFNQMEYGNHPFSRLYPSEQMLRGFTIARSKDFYTKNFGAKRSHLYVSGVFDAAAVEKAVRTTFDDWQSGEPATENPPVPAARRQVKLIDRAGAVQSTMWMGVPAARVNDPDRMSMLVTNALIGGSFGSRIMSNIREDKGYAYSPYSQLISTKGSALWVEVADVTTNVTGASITEIVKEVNRLRAEAPPTAELEGIKSQMVGNFTLRNSSRAGLVSQLQTIDLHQLPADYLSTYVSRVMAVTPENVRATAQKHLDPEKLSIVIVGDKKTVEPQLGLFRPIVP
ncbi:MAG: pitrilysin family protein [Gemmatimonas sp.]